jgi:hypothetical protein
MKKHTPEAFPPRRSAIEYESIRGLEALHPYFHYQNITVQDQISMNAKMRRAVLSGTVAPHAIF